MRVPVVVQNPGHRPVEWKEIPVAVFVLRFRLPPSVSTKGIPLCQPAITMTTNTSAPPALAAAVTLAASTTTSRDY